MTPTCFTMHNDTTPLGGAGLNKLDTPFEVGERHVHRIAGRHVEVFDPVLFVSKQNEIEIVKMICRGMTIVVHTLLRDPSIPHTC